MLPCTLCVLLFAMHLSLLSEETRGQQPLYSMVSTNSQDRQEAQAVEQNSNTRHEATLASPSNTASHHQPVQIPL